MAQNGTLLFDEIGEMPLGTQAKLLRILEDSKVRRLGGKHEFEVDVRVVAATNKVPEEAVRGGHLREDLFYRLNVFQVHLPPLARTQAGYPADRRGTSGRPEPQARMPRRRDFPGGARSVLERHHWPGNVRELRNVLERAVILAGEGAIEMQHLPAFLQIRTPGGEPTHTSAGAAVAPAAPEQGGVRFQIGTTVEEAERGLILRTLEFTRNNKTRAAEILGISLKTLHNKLKEYGSSSDQSAGA